MALPIQLPRDINFQPYNVLRFGADPTGQTDSRLAFKAAVFFAVTGYPLPKSLVTGSDMYDFPKFTAGPNKGNPIIPCFPDVLYPNLVYSTARL